MKTTTIQTILLIVASIALSACGNIATKSVSTTTASEGGLSGNPAQQVASENSTLVKSGNWSTSEVELSVTASGATLNLGCGSGVLNSALVLDANNSFAVVGMYSSGVGMSSVASDGTVTSAQNQAVVYSGAYDAEQDTLTVVIQAEANGQTITRLTLNYGDPSSPIVNCE